MGTWKGALALALLNYGSRILERLLWSGPKEEMAAWCHSLIQEAEMLSKHGFGNFVITSMLEHGSFKMRSEILEKLLPKMPELSCHEIAHKVVQQAMKYSSGAGLHSIF